MQNTTWYDPRVPSEKGFPTSGPPIQAALRIWIALSLFTVMAAGCVRIPEPGWTISHRDPFETRRQNAECTAAGIVPFTPDPIGTSRIEPERTVRSAALNPNGFSVVNWNIYKGNKEGWAADFQKFSRDADILVLQEAYLTDRLKKLLREGPFHWDMTVAFEYREIETGVLTAARSTPNFICTFQQSEPITSIPKSALITRYPLSGTVRELLVANIHAINFSMDASAYQQQIDRLEEILVAYRGPLILAGDFNTWSTGRMSRVNAMAARLDLVALRFEQNRRSRFFGRIVDHVFYRGLEVKHATTPIVSTSDHNPLMVVFKLAEDASTGH